MSYFSGWLDDSLQCLQPHLSLNTCNEEYTTQNNSANNCYKGNFSKNEQRLNFTLLKSEKHVWCSEAEDPLWKIPCACN